MENFKEEFNKIADTNMEELEVELGGTEFNLQEKFQELQKAYKQKMESDARSKRISGRCAHLLEMLNGTTASHLH